MKCRACKMDMPNGATVCPYCRTNQRKSTDLSCSGMLGALCCIIACLAMLAMCSRSDDEANSNTKKPSTTTVSTASPGPISESEQQALIDSLSNMTKVTYGKNFEITYENMFNYYSIRVWDEKITEASKTENNEEWEKIKEQAASFESRLNQQVKSVDQTAYATFAFSTAETDYESLLLISNGELLLDFGYKEPEETTAPEETPATTTYPKINGFLIGDREGTTYDGYCEVVGVVANATGYNCSYVQITIGFYNENDVKIDSGIDNILNLNAGETWQYEVTGFGDGITNFRIDDITWY